jgi:prepilin-type N-terminal cleavage/methylation domain-containing protein
MDRHFTSGIIMHSSPRRCGFTLVELLVVTAIIVVLVGLIVPAVQKVREAGNRTECSNHLRQIGLALQAYYHNFQVLPQAYSTTGTGDTTGRNWAAAILPYLEMDNLQRQGRTFYDGQTVALFLCPSEPRGGNPTGGSGPTGYTHYLAVEGTDYQSTDGLLYHDSQTRFADVKDGLSNTIMIGERPPSPDLFWGHWARGPFDSALGARSTVIVNTYSSGARPAEGATPCTDRLPGNFAAGLVDDYCDTHHFWSFHPGGGLWLFGDASVRFLSHAAAPIIPQLATRAGGEIVDVSGY